MMHKNIRTKELATHGAHISLRFFAGATGWAGEILLLFGAYSWFFAGDIILLGLGFSLICFGEGLALLKKITHAEIQVLRETLLRQMGRNMLFPILWLLLFFVISLDLLLAIAIATGAKAIVKNTRLVATSYIFS